MVTTQEGRGINTLTSLCSTLQLPFSTSHWLNPTGSQRARELLMLSMKADLPEDRVGRKEQRVGQEGQMEETQHRSFHDTS